MEILKKLISIYSVSGSEKEILGYIQEFLTKVGLEPLTIGDNLLIKIAGDDTTKALVFNAHVDTVAIGDISAWETPPLIAVEKGGKLYGLGASDEKAAVATLLLLAADYQNKKPPCDVFLLFVSQEEVDGSGTKAVLEYFDRQHRNDYLYVGGILGEPTGMKEIEIAHKGNLFLKITTQGESGHASNPNGIKTHAVEEMITVGHILKKLQYVWEKIYNDKILGAPSIGMFTSIVAGDPSSPNKFPDTCIATIDVRTIPQMHHIAFEEIQKAIYPAQATYLYPAAPYGYTDASAAIVKISKDISKANIVASTWSNDLCFFTEKQIPAVVLGPGERKVIHKANEYCYPHKIKKCVNVYHKIIKEFACQ